MKKLIIVVSLFLMFTNISFSQYKYHLIENIIFKLEKYGVNPNIFGGATLKCSEDINTPFEDRFRIYFTGIFHDFSTKKTIDFNNVSLVDVDNKIRYRPDGVSSGSNWGAYEIEIEDKLDDPFIIYSQDSIKNFDFYTYKVTNVNRKKLYRLKPHHFKSKNGIELTFSFPVFKNRKDSGKFKIFWKNELIGEFTIKDGVSIY